MLQLGDGQIIDGVEVVFNHLVVPPVQVDHYAGEDEADEGQWNDDCHQLVVLFVLLDHGNNEVSASVSDQRVVEVVQVGAPAGDRLWGCICEVLEDAVPLLGQGPSVDLAIRPRLPREDLIVAIVVRTEGLVVEEVVLWRQDLLIQHGKGALGGEVTDSLLVNQSRPLVIQGANLRHVLVLEVILLAHVVARNRIALHKAGLDAQPFEAK